MKCSNCWYCEAHPPRLGEKMDNLHWLPDPQRTPDGEDWLPFDQVYGTPTTDDQRPGLKEKQKGHPEDTRNCKLLVSGNKQRQIKINSTGLICAVSIVHDFIVRNIHLELSQKLFCGF